MDPELLVEQKDDGYRLIKELIRSGFDVTAAFWVRPTEHSSWLLYISSETFDPKKSYEAYRWVYEAIGRENSSFVSPADVKLIHPSDPVSVAVVMLLNRYPSQSGKNFDGKWLGPLAVEGAFLYPRERWFQGFDEIKQQFPSAQVISLPILGKDLRHPATLALTGHINANEFEGKKPGTLYFLGSKGSSGKALAELDFVWRPEGWNALYRPDTKAWEEVVHVQTGKRLYESADFGQLLALKTDRRPAADELERIRERMEGGGYRLTTTLHPDPIASIPVTLPGRPGGRPATVVSWELLRQIMEAGGTVSLTPVAEFAKT